MTELVRSDRVTFNRAAKSWCYTLNNYNEREYKMLKDVDCNYHILAKEVGELSNVPHLQGCITFKTAKRMTALKKNISLRAHWSIAIGLEESRNYCIKGGDYLVIDNRQQGSRTDLHDACDTLKKKGMLAVREDHPTLYVKYHRGFHALKYDCDVEPRNSPPSVLWIHGPTGCGKTRYAHEQGMSVYVKDETKWWDGYHGQDIILFDDFRGGIMFNTMLKILDRYPYAGEKKGGYVNINSKFIIITSNHDARDTYVNLTSERIDQLIRRINETWDMGESAELEPLNGIVDCVNVIEDIVDLSILDVPIAPGNCPNDADCIYPADHNGICSTQDNLFDEDHFDVCLCNEDFRRSGVHSTLCEFA